MSLVETLISIATISTIATLAYAIISTAIPETNQSKLESQVATLNASAAMYRINGGYIDPFATTSEVFAKLQMIATDADRVVGLAGSMVDPNLVAITTTEDEVEDTSIPRVVWNPDTHRFSVTHEKQLGITAFSLDEKGAADRVAGSESRHRGGAVKYAAVEDWVWDYVETPITSGGPSYIPGPGGGYGGPGTPPVPASDVLYPPLISTPEGTYPITAYPLEVTLANPNPPGSSDVYYSINRGPVRLYHGETFTFDPHDFIAARCEPKTDDWKRSIFSVAYYQVSPVKLEVPIIRASAPQFDWDINDTIYVSIDNPNNPSVSKIEYRTNGGDWKAYNGRSKRFKERDYPEGVDVECRAIATAEYYLDSGIASRQVGPAVSTVLNPPVITFSHADFSDEIDEIGVTIENPNPGGSSDVYYALTDPEAERDETRDLRFKKYRREFDEDASDWPHGFAVITYAKATSQQYQDSLPAEKETGHEEAPSPEAPPVEVGLAGGHFDLDTSSFIAEFHKGTTDAHVHEYDKKFGVPGANFFDLKGGKLHNITDDVPPGAKFKLIVVNPDLSPGARLVINKEYDDDDPTTWIPVQEYTAIALEDLPIFSFNGISGTTQLTHLGLYFDVNAIANSEIVPTNTGDVRANVPGKNGEWRNGALAIQAVKVTPDNRPDFATSSYVTNGGKHGAATKGLLWESTLFWHWEGDSYHEPENPHGPTPYVPPTTDPDIPPTITRYFSGHADGIFHDPTGESNLLTNLSGGNRDNYFEWGNPAAGSPKGSNIAFHGRSFNNVAVDELFALGTMQFQNNTIDSDTDARTVKFDLDLSLDVPSLTETLGFSFDLYSTVNRNDQTADENADYFTFGTFSSNFSTVLDGQLYGLALQFGEINSNGFSTIDEFHTHEGKTATGTLYGMFYAIDPLDLAQQVLP